MKKLISFLIILVCMLCLLVTSAMAQPGGGPQGGPGAGGPGMGGHGGRQEMGQGGRNGQDGNRDRSRETRANTGNNQNGAEDSVSQKPESQNQMPQNQMPQNQMPQNQMPQGQMPQGQMPQGQMPQGQPGFAPDNMNGYGAPMGPGLKGQPADNFDELVKNGVIDQETYEGILAYMQTNRPGGQMLPPQTQESETTEKPEEPAELLSDLLSAGIITQEQYEAIVAARPASTQTTENSETAE